MSGQPIANATLAIEEPRPGLGAGRPVLSGLSQADGSFSLTGVLPGDYVIYVRAPGRLQHQQPVSVGASPAPMTVIVPDRATVAGQVLGADGAPAAAAKVEATVTSTGHGFPSFERTITGPDGRFDLSKLGPGRLRLHVRRELEVGDAELELEDPGAPEVTVRLALGARLSGTVRDERGRALGGIDVYAVRRPELLAPAHARTDAEGRYTIGPVAPGALSVSALVPGNKQYFTSAPRPEQQQITVTAGEDRHDVDFRLPEQNLRLDGQVLDPAGYPLAGIAVYLAFEGMGERPADGERRALSGAEGRFAFDQLAPGSYRLRAEHSEHPMAILSGARVGAGPVTLRFPEAAALDGELRDTAGRPIARAQLVLVGKGDRKSERVPLDLQDPRGRFRFPRIARGQYELHATAAPDLVGTVPTIDVAAGHSNQVTLALRPSATISGRLVSRDDQQRARGWSITVRSLGRDFTATSDNDGRFSLAGIDGLQSLVLAFHPPGGGGQIYPIRVDPPGAPRGDLGDFEISSTPAGRWSLSRGSR
jgi:protocatechuate 3,4-dioxygenase beta subunit